MIRIAKMQYNIGYREEATTRLRNGLTDNPQSVELRLSLAELALAEGRPGQAMEHLDDVLKREPVNVDAMRLKGLALRHVGQPDQALEWYKRARELADSSQLVIGHAKALKEAGNHDTGLNELENWIGIHPTDTKVLAVTAFEHRNAGDAERAVELYRRLTELEPSSVFAFNNLAYALISADIEQALAAARRAYELAPDSAAVLDTLGWIYKQLGRLDDALVHLREAVARDSQSPTYRYHLAIALLEFGKSEEAISQLRQALRSRRYFAEREAAQQRLAELGERVR
jgi:tetratricopeptide (TPR) repeat protein